MLESKLIQIPTISLLFRVAGWVAGWPGGWPGGWLGGWVGGRVAGGIENKANSARLG